MAIRVRRCDYPVPGDAAPVDSPPPPGFFHGDWGYKDTQPPLPRLLRAAIQLSIRL